MSNRTLLMLTFSYPPRQVPSTFRVVRFTRFLPELGWRCVVVTPRAECHAMRVDELSGQIHPLTEEFRIACGDPGEHLRKWMEQHPGERGGLRYTSVKALDRLVSLLCVPDSRILTASRMLRVAMQVIRSRRIDAVWLTAPPFSIFSIVPALKRLSALPVVLDLRDPWTTSPIRFEGRFLWKRGPERRLERRVFALADRIIVNTQYALREYQSIYPELVRDRASVIPNSYDPEDFSSITAEPFGQKVLLHAGNSGGIRTARWLIEAMGRLRNEGLLGPESFRYISYGPGGPEEHAAATQSGVADMVEFRGSRPHQEVLAAMMGASALLLLVGEGHEASIPSKLYEYLAVARPVLMAGSPHCAAADVIRATGVGKVVALSDAGSLKAALLEILNGTLASAHVDRQGVKAFQSRSVSELLARVLNELVPGGT